MRQAAERDVGMPLVMLRIALARDGPSDTSGRCNSTASATVRRFVARRTGDAGPCALVEEAEGAGQGLVLVNMLQVRLPKR